MPAAVPVIAAGITGLAALGGSKISANASGRAARIQSDAANEAARIVGLTADKQLAFAREQADLANANADADRFGNYGQWRAGMQNDRAGDITGLRNSWNQAGDTAFNNRSSDVSRGRTDVGMFNTGAYNNRALRVADMRNANAKDVVRQQRLGVLGELIGQGPRQIAAYEDPAALREAQYFEPDPLKRTDLELPPDLILPDYVPRKNNA